MKDNLFQGKWYIYEMGMWDEDYFNMEVQVYIKNTNEMLEFNLGDKYLWFLRKDFKNGGKPENGTID